MNEPTIEYLKEKLGQAMARAETAERACVAQAEAINEWRAEGFIVIKDSDPLLSPACGQGWHSPQEWEALQAILKDPAAVWVNMLRGEIAMPERVKDNNGLRAQLSRVSDERDAALAKCEQMRPLLEEVMREHADPTFCDYNGCDKEPCMWCSNAKQALSDSPTSPIMLASELDPFRQLLDRWLAYYTYSQLHKMDSKLQRDTLSVKHRLEQLLKGSGNEPGTCCCHCR